MNKILLFFSAFLPLSLFAQILPLQTICPFPKSLRETSGIFSADKGKTIWTHTDSGGKNKLYKMDTLGNILRKIVIKNATNTDWEDITTDNMGNVYIGDFGNNENIRQDLKIYKIQNPDSTKNDTITAEIIRFSYSNQSLFPPKSKQKNFNVEAFVWCNDSLHLFSKNETSPFNGYTQHFVLPVDTGQQLAQIRDSFLMGTANMFSFWVTSAGMNVAHNQLVLLSSDKIALFSHFSGTNFLQGEVQIFPLSDFSQKEGVCFANDSMLYISDEYFSALKVGGNLYKVHLPKPNKAETDFSERNISFFFTPKIHEIAIYFSEIPEKGHISILTTNGKVLLEANKIEEEMKLSTLAWKKGVYVLCWNGKMIGKIKIRKSS